MKKILFAALTLCLFMSCQKDEIDIKQESSPITFMAEIESSKTTVSDAGKVNWCEGDEITITSNKEEGVGIYTVSGWDSHRFANLTYKSGTHFTVYDANYTATYGDINNQWYIDTDHSGSNCPMKADQGVMGESSVVKFSFKNDCGIVAVKANTGGNKIARITIGEKSLNFATPQVLNGTYMVALNPEETFDIVAFIKDDGSKSSKNISSTSVILNQIRDLNTGTYFSSSEYSGFEPVLLPGKFTVNSSGGQVQFTKGNLWINTSDNSTRMESNQFDYRTVPGKGAVINGTTATTANNQYGLRKFDDRITIEGYRYLGGKTSTKEFNYIINSRTNCSKIGNTDNARWALVRVNAVNGIMLFPDKIDWPNDITAPKNINTVGTKWGDKTQYDESSQFQKLETLGVVFLPAAGYLSGDTDHSIGETGRYVQETKTDFISFTYYQPEEMNDGSDYAGSLRLIKDVQ